MLAAFHQLALQSGLMLEEECTHNEISEISTDFNNEGEFLRLVRCEKCGLLIRQSLPIVSRNRRRLFYDVKA